MVFSHIEDYYILLQISYNTPQTEFDGIFDDYTDDIENVIYEKCSKLNINLLNIQKIMQQDPEVLKI